MDYREHQPREPLGSVIDCIWTLEGEHSGGDGEPVMPDGRAELVAHLGDPFERVFADGAAVRQPLAIFAGQLTEHLVLRPTGHVAVVGVRFRPDGAALLLRVPQHELVGLTIGLDEVSAPLARMVGEVRGSTDAPKEAADMIQDRLVQHMREIAVDRRIRHVVTSIRHQHGCVSVDALAGHVGLTRRHLERRFRDLVGISPKRLARIARFQRALAVLESGGTTCPGTTAAAECGYADQAHFIRDFRDLAGCAPGEHLLRNAELTGFFLERTTRGVRP